MIATFLLAFSMNSAGLEFAVGASADDWWTAYPDQSPDAGGDVNHPSWVLDALKSRPVLIYVHGLSTDNAPQTLAVENIKEEFKNQITSFEIISDSGDARSEEALHVYDPNGGLALGQMTAIVTLAPNSEAEVVPVWHSTEEITGESWIRNYVADAIVQYDENSADWSP